METKEKELQNTEKEEQIETKEKSDIKIEEKSEEVKTEETKESIENILKQKEEEIKIWKERALRYAAEVENLKKMFKREKEEYYKFALESVFKELLNSIDNLERALDAFEESQNIEALKEGVYLSLKVLMQTLEKYGLKQFSPEIGEAFHPHYHEALSTETHPEIPNGGIVKVYQKGYKLHDRVIRPALVAVSIGKQEESKQEEKDVTESK